MAQIRVYKNEKANTIVFEGGAFSTYWNGLLTASVNGTEPTGIDIMNLAATSGSSTIDFSKSASNAYEYFQYPFTSFVDETGSLFGTATECANYINSKAQTVALSDEITTNVQGYYSLLTDAYYGGNGTTMSIDINDVDIWQDVKLDIYSSASVSGISDQRPTVMVQAQPQGYEIYSGSNIFKFHLEGLDASAFGAFRSSMTFDPDEDGGQVEARILFSRTTGSNPINDFSIADTVLNADQGADTDYPIIPNISFFVGDTIETKGIGNGGKFRFQIKSTVPGTFTTKEFAFDINR